MKVDDVVLRFLNEVGAELKEAKGLDLSVAEIGKIYHGYLEGAVYAMNKGIEVRLEKIGSFKRIYKEEIRAGKKALKEMKDSLSEKDLAKKELEMKLAKIARYKERHKPFQTTNLKTLVNTPKISKIESIFNKVENV